MVNAQTNVNAQGISADQREILRLEDLLTEAWAKNDTATISAIVADDFQYWSFKGVRRNKADLLRAVSHVDLRVPQSGQGRFRTEAFDRSEEASTKIEDPMVRIYADAAVYTARIIDVVKHADRQEFTAKSCVTVVFIRRSGKWQMVAEHETLLPAGS
jgi:hypothetical protein